MNFTTKIRFVLTKYLPPITIARLTLERMGKSMTIPVSHKLGTEQLQESK